MTDESVVVPHGPAAVGPPRPRRARDAGAGDGLPLPLRGSHLQFAHPAVHGAVLAAGRGSRRPHHPVRRRPVHRGVDDLGLSTVDMATHWSPFGHVLVYIGVNVGALGVLALHPSSVSSSRSGWACARNSSRRATPAPLRAHGGPVNEGQTVRLGEVGQLLSTVALSTLVISRARGAALPVGAHQRRRRRDGALGGAVLRGDVVHEHGLHSQRGRPHPVRAGLLLPHGADGGRLPRGSIGFPVIFTLWRHHFHVRAGRSTRSSPSSRR